MTLTSLTPEQIAFIKAQGLNPDDYALDASYAPQQEVAPTSSALGAGGRAALASAVPTFAGGAAAGATAGLLGGPAAPVTSTIGAIIGAMAGGYAAGKAQEALMPEEWKAKLAQDAAEHPVSTTVGSLATMPLGGMSLNPKTAVKALSTIPEIVAGKSTQAGRQALINSGIGSAIGGVQEAVMQKLQGQDLDAGAIARQAAIGFAFNDPSAIGKRVYGFHEAPVRALDNPAQLRGKIPTAVKVPEVEGQKVTPDGGAAKDAVVGTPRPAYYQHIDKLNPNLAPKNPVYQGEIPAGLQQTLAQNPPKTRTELEQRVEQWFKDNDKSTKAYALDPKTQKRVPTEFTQTLINELGEANNIKTVENPALGEGKRGSAIPGDNTVTLNPNEATNETKIHEDFHARETFRKLPPEQKALVRAEAEAKAGKKLTVDEVEEHFVQQSALKMLEQRLNILDEGAVKRWFGDLRSNFKVRWNTKGADVQDVYRSSAFDLAEGNRPLPKGQIAPKGGQPKFQQSEDEYHRPEGTEQAYWDMWKEYYEKQKKAGVSPEKAKELFATAYKAVQEAPEPPRKFSQEGLEQTEPELPRGTTPNFSQEINSATGKPYSRTALWKRKKLRELLGGPLQHFDTKTSASRAGTRGGSISGKITGGKSEWSQNLGENLAHMYVHTPLAERTKIEWHPTMDVPLQSLTRWKLRREAARLGWNNEIPLDVVKDIISEVKTDLLTNGIDSDGLERSILRRTNLALNRFIKEQKSPTGGRSVSMDTPVGEDGRTLADTIASKEVKGAPTLPTEEAAAPEPTPEPAPVELPTTELETVAKTEAPKEDVVSEVMLDKDTALSTVESIVGADSETFEHIRDLADDAELSIEDIKGLLAKYGELPAERKKFQQEGLEQTEPEIQERLRNSTVKEPVYHSTPADYDRANPDVARKQRDTASVFGMHFGSKEQAEKRFDNRMSENEQWRTTPYYIIQEKPFRVTDIEANAPLKMERLLSERRMLTPEDKAALNEINISADDQIKRAELLLSVLKRRGYDGLVYANEAEGGGDSYVVFDKENIINAIAPKRAETGELYQEGGMEQTEPEYIRLAATKAKDGTITTARNHYDASYYREGERKGMAVFEPKFGFTTNTGRFVSRKEALSIARQAKQLNDYARKRLAHGNLKELDTAYLEPDWDTKYQKEGLDPTEPIDVGQKDTTKQAFFEPMASTFDKVKRISTPVAQAFVNFSKQQRRFLGERNAVLKDLSKFSNEEIAEAVTQLRANYRDLDKKPLNEAAKVLQQYFTKTRDFQIEQGLTIGGREAGKNEFYVPDMLNDKTIDILVNKSQSPEAKAIENAWVEHAIKEAKDRADVVSTINEKEIKENIAHFINALGGKHGNYKAVEFGAIRKASGYGLPEGLRETDGARIVEKYGRRYAADLSLYMHLEKPKAIAGSLMLRDPNTGRISQEGDAGISRATEVRDAMKWVTGGFAGTISTSMPKINSFVRLVNNSLLGPATGIRDTVSIPANMLPYINKFSDLKAAWDGMMKFRENQRRALESGATQPNMDRKQFGDLMQSPDRFTAVVGKLATLMRKYQGRELLENFNRDLTFSVGRELASHNVIGAKGGNEKSIQWLKKFGDLVEGDVTKMEGAALDKALDTMAANFTDRNQGTYGGEGLPVGVVESQFAPFLSMQKWSWEKSNVIYKDVVKPFLSGENRLPMLTYVFGSFMTGVAIQQLNELMSGKKPNDPTLKETIEYGGALNYAAELATLMQMGSFAGLVGDAMKLTSDKLITGKTPRNIVSFPAATLSADLVEKTGDMLEALRQGEDAWPVFKQYAMDTMVANVQAARMVANHTIKAGDIERSDKFRDMRVFNQLEGKPASNIPQVNRYLGIGSKQFKQERDLEKAVGQSRELVRKALSSGNVEQMRRTLKGLKGNNYSTVPDPTTRPQEFQRYYQFIVRTQGQQAANELLRDYFTMKAVNRAKSQLIPSI